MRQFRWIWQYFQKYKLRYAIGLCLVAVVVFLGLVNPYIGGIIVKDVFEQGNTEPLIRLLLIMIGVTFVKTLIRYTFAINFELISQGLIYRMRMDIYDRIQQQSFRFFDDNRVGDIMSRMTGDMDAIRHFAAYVIYSLFEHTLTFVCAIILMFTISWQLTLVMLLVAPAICFFTFRQAIVIKPAFSKIREQFSKLNSVCQENISGNRIIKAFTRETYEIEKFTEENQAYYQYNVDASDIWGKYLPPQEFIVGMMNLVMLLVGGIMVILDRMKLYQLVTINGYLWALNNPMRMIGWLVNDLQRAVASLDKIYDMMRTKIRVKNPENPHEAGKLAGAVAFQDVSFAYDKYNDKAIVLKHISFEAAPGQTVGIVGPTGSGKSTLVNLISRFYDVTEGAVLVDGVNVKDYQLQSLRRDISSAMQDVFLFSDTVEGNIAYGVPDASMEAVTGAAKVADANDFIEKMSESYDTIVGERGVGLSGGQKQRLSLARAIATEPSILILDDTTSAVDMETEHEIQQALKARYADRTKFIIAHRISSVKSADLILVLVDGEIIERGTHDELLAQKGYYYTLYRNQYGDYTGKEAI